MMIVMLMIDNYSFMKYAYVKATNLRIHFKQFDDDSLCI